MDNKKIIRFILLVIIAAVVGVGINATYKYNSVKKIAGNVEVWAYGPYYDYLNKLSYEFIEKYPKVKIKVKNVSKEEIDKELNKIDNNNTPNLILMNSMEIQRNLNEDSKKINNINGTVRSFLSSYDSGRITEIKSGQDYFGMPFDGRPMVMYFNDEYLKQFNINFDEIKTWKEFIEAGKTLYTKTEGKKKLCYIDKASMQEFTRVLMYQLGVSEDEKDLLKEQNKITKVSQLLDSLVKENVVEQVEDANTIINSSVILGSIEKSKFIKGLGKESWSVSYIPSFEEGGNSFVSLEGNNLVLTSTKDEKASLEFMVFALTNVKEMVELMQKEEIFPVFNPCYESGKFEEVVSNLGNKKYFDMLSNIQINQRPHKAIYKIDKLSKNLYP